MIATPNAGLNNLCETTAVILECVRLLWLTAYLKLVHVPIMHHVVKLQHGVLRWQHKMSSPWLQHRRPCGDGTEAVSRPLDR